MNQAVFSGYVGQDADCKYTQSGKAVASFSLAVDNGKDNEGEKRTLWVKCVLWEKRAESLTEYIKKGKYVVVSGPVSTEAWISKDSGDAQAKLVLTVREFNFGGGGSKNEDSQSGGSPEAQQRRYPPQRERDEAQSTQIQDEDIPF